MVTNVMEFYLKSLQPSTGCGHVGEIPEHQHLQRPTMERTRRKILEQGEWDAVLVEHKNRLKTSQDLVIQDICKTMDGICIIELTHKTNINQIKMVQ